MEDASLLTSEKWLSVSNILGKAFSMPIQQQGTPRHRGRSKIHLKEMHGGGAIGDFKPKSLDTWLLNCLVNHCCNLIDEGIRSFENYIFLSVLYI